MVTSKRVRLPQPSPRYRGSSIGTTVVAAPGASRRRSRSDAAQQFRLLGGELLFRDDPPLAQVVQFNESITDFRCGGATARTRARGGARRGRGNRRRRRTWPRRLDLRIALGRNDGHAEGWRVRAVLRIRPEPPGPHPDVAELVRDRLGAAAADQLVGLGVVYPL